MNLDNFISALRQMPKAAKVDFDFACTCPTKFYSYRMDTSMVCLGWRGTSYSDTYEGNKGHFSDVTVKKLLAMCQEVADGKEFERWKGGITKGHPNIGIMIANDGDPSQTGILAVVRNYEGVVILTTRMERL